MNASAFLSLLPRALVVGFVVLAFPMEPVAAAMSSLKIKLIRKRDQDADKSRKDDYDNKQERLSFTLKLENGSLDPVEGLKATFILVGQLHDDSLKRREMAYMVIDTQEVDIELAANERKEVDIPGVLTKFDDNYDAKHGASYGFYALVLSNADGEVIERVTDRKSILKTEDDYATLQDFREKRDVFDKKLERHPLKPHGIKVRPLS